MASEQDALRAWVQSRKATPWSPGFSEDFKRGYDTAVEEVEAALTASPVVDMTPILAELEEAARQETDAQYRHGVLWSVARIRRRLAARQEPADE